MVLSVKVARALSSNGFGRGRLGFRPDMSRPQLWVLTGLHTALVLEQLVTLCKTAHAFWRVYVYVLSMCHRYVGFTRYLRVTCHLLHNLIFKYIPIPCHWSSNTNNKKTSSTHIKSWISGEKRVLRLRCACSWFWTAFITSKQSFSLLSCPSSSASSLRFAQKPSTALHIFLMGWLHDLFLEISSLDTSNRLHSWFWTT